LQFTRSWLQRGADLVNTRKVAAESSAATEAELASSSDASASSAQPVPSATANAALNAAFLEVLDWDDDRVFPEVSHYLSVIFVPYIGKLVRAPGAISIGPFPFQAGGNRGDQTWL